LEGIVFVSEVVSRSENCFRGRGKQEIDLPDQITGFLLEIQDDASLCIASELDLCAYIYKLFFCKIGTSHICLATLHHFNVIKMFNVTAKFLVVSVLICCSVVI
jgi:hypothetical protein